VGGGGGNGDTGGQENFGPFGEFQVSMWGARTGTRGERGMIIRALGTVQLIMRILGESVWQ